MSHKNSIKVPAHKAVVQLDTPVHRYNPEEAVLVNRQQMDRIKQANDYATTPPVQVAVGALTASTDIVENKLSAIEAKRSELATLLQERDVAIIDMHRDRDTLRSAISAAARGSADAIKAWNCFVLTKQSAAAGDEPPIHLRLKISPTTPGTVTATCKAIKGAGAYLFAFTTDPNAAAGSGQLVTSTKCRSEIAGQTVGHILYARVAVTRLGGQSTWSDPVQILVR